MSRNEHDDKLMEEWLNSELDRIDSAEAQVRMAAAYWSKPGDQELSGDPIINAALSGDLEPLRRRHPDLAAADLLKLPKRDSGKRFQKNKMRSAMKSPAEWKLTQAVWDAAIIRDLWKKHYGAKPRGYDSAEDIAAKRWGVKADHVIEWKKSKLLPKNPYRR